MHQNYSLSIFFPCYNDKGTIASLVLEAKKAAQQLTNDFEIIVIDDGSKDGSRELLLGLRSQVPELKLVFHEKNKGYGEVLRSGIKASTKELIFYTDGDGQYDVRELPRLWAKLTPDIDVVNGYKIRRSDPPHRIVIGYIYQYFIKFLFALKIKDVDCDFRLMRRKIFDSITLTRNEGTVCVELVKKIELGGFKFAEVGVSHLFRTYGQSQFFNFRRVFRTLWKLAFLWLDLIVFRRIGKRK